MTQEEKAKAYDKAIEKIKYVMEHGVQPVLNKEDLQDIFPELKESEDEKIRNELIRYFKIYNEDISPDFYIITGISIKDILAWLEKQGEQKPTDARYKVKVGDSLSVGNGTPFDYEHSTITQKDFASKVEPKFKVGDWITDGYLHNKITDVLEDRYIVETKYVKRSAILFEHESRYHLWTIADAKDGDVLKYKRCTFIFKKTEPSDIVTNIKNPLTVLGYCGINHIGFEKTNGWGDTANCKYYPATKEQRDLLFQKMKEAGYEWDAEKKELRKMTQKPNDRLDPLIDDEIDLWIKENSDIHHDNNDIVELMRDMAYYVATLTRNLYRQKPKWTEEDEQYLLICKNALKKYDITDKWDSTIIIRWLENKIKQRMEEQQ